MDPSSSNAPLCRRWKLSTILRMAIICIISILAIIYIVYIYSYYTNYMCNAGWLKSVDSQIVHELDHREPVLYVIPIEIILRKLLIVPVGDTGTIPPPSQRLSRRIQRPQAGCGRWMQDVICQLLGLGLVQ